MFNFFIFSKNLSISVFFFIVFFQQCTQNLYERIKTATYRSIHEDDDEYIDDFNSGTRILAIAYPEERLPYCILWVCIGFAKDFIFLPIIYY